MNNTQPTIPEKVAIPLPEVQRRDNVFLLLILLFSCLTANGIYAGGMQLGFAVGVLTLLTTALLYLRKNMCMTPLGILCLISAFAVTVSFAVHENTAFASLKFPFLLLAISLFLVSACKIKAPSLDDFRSLLSPAYLLIGGSCSGIPMTTGALTENGGGKLKKLGKVLLALGVSLPLLAALTLLLMYADRAFEGFMDSINLNFGELVYTLFFGCVITLFLFSLLFVIRKDRVKLHASPRKPYLAAFDALSINTVLTAVSLLYLVFLVTQLSYLIGGFAGLLPADYTYADYARRGFFEICIISALNLGMLLTAEFFVKRDTKEKLPVSTRALSIFISGFSLFLIAAVIAKMLLYIRSYGLTFLRLGTSLFMLLLFVVFTAMILKNFVQGFKTMRVILAAACILMTVTAAIEPYNVIANYNLYAYQSGMHDAYELDTNYLAYNCGSYGVQALIELAEDGNVYVVKRAEERLEKMHPRYYYRTDTNDLRELSLARLQAREALAKYYAK